MNTEDLVSVFERQAEHYDSRWQKVAPVYLGLYFLLESVFSSLSVKARVLCVGVGTGKELLYLAAKFPGWRFTAVEPSLAMLDVCRRNAEAAGIAERCQFHHGFLDSLPEADNSYDAATCFLVSQFILNQQDRVAFFEQIARKLKLGAILATADLCADTESVQYDELLPMWCSFMSGARATTEQIDRTKDAYTRDVAVLSADKVTAIIAAGGFELPVPFFQSGLLQGWFTRRI
ncbi:methyltransferase domain-containing protein [Rheinheimera aquimaris]|uniref:class I SAM-dependent methyltransferase n=1 Tax=Rheinheimera aquimaris TaxID=412437 RepID=UPI001CFFD58D|nr:class I SAM-dependent methyltransferase [Rheinheimera aquimaris]MCB5214981.1 methyltransferase domain-containing protein [Rheinheimera aquimaris]